MGVDTPVVNMDAHTLHGSSNSRVPEYSRLHPVVPRLYDPEWKSDMKNRRLIVENAELGGIPHFEHDENLFLDKREQMVYNVEDRQRVESKYNLPPRSKMLRPDFTHPTSKYQSSLMFRRDNKKEAL